jgi:hypothetical protein
MLKDGLAKTLLKKFYLKMAYLYLLCLFAPLPLWLIEQLLPFPFVIEELFKYVIVKFAPSQKDFRFPLIAGILFSLSESILYLINFFQLGNFELFPYRIMLTTLLHTTTFCLLYNFRSSRLFSIMSLLLAIIIHYLYNLLVPTLF